MQRMHISLAPETAGTAGQLWCTTISNVYLLVQLRKGTEYNSHSLELLLC